MAGRPKRWKYSGSELKKRMLEGLIDKENKCKISDREFLRTKSNELTIDGKNVGTGIWTFWTKHPEIIDSEPLKGERICEETAYKYAIQCEYWTEEEVPYDDFTNNTMKIKNQLDEMTIQRMIEKKIFSGSLSELTSLGNRETTCKIAVGEGEFEMLKKKFTKELLMKNRVKGR